MFDESALTPALAKSLCWSLLFLVGSLIQFLNVILSLRGVVFRFLPHLLFVLGVVTSQPICANFKILPTIDFETFISPPICLIVILVCCRRETIWARFLGVISIISASIKMEKSKYF